MDIMKFKISDKEVGGRLYYDLHVKLEISMWYF